MQLIFPGGNIKWLGLQKSNITQIKTLNSINMNAGVNISLSGL